MIFTETDLQGAYTIEPEKLADNRGFFGRTWCQQEFRDRGLDSQLVQCSISFNHQQGTLRGMHLQLPPSAEAKLVRCTQGAIYDVIVDLRSNSETYLQWTAIELTAENRTALYIPPGLAHGFQTLANNTEIFYQMSDFYHPDLARGFRWNDPIFKIDWPEEVRVIADRDREYPDYTPESFSTLQLTAT
jgi:dTDP-4-dehydrorhamnose 3,5-epimerase